jgi:hypothetical protein
MRQGPPLGRLVLEFVWWTAARIEVLLGEPPT